MEKSAMKFQFKKTHENIVICEYIKLFDIFSSFSMVQLFPVIFSYLFILKWLEFENGLGNSLLL